MYKIKILTFFLASVLLTTFTGCSKDDEEDVSPNVSLLTAGTWTGNAVYTNGDNITAEFEDQTQIDITKYTTTFKREGTYTDSYEGDVVANGTWAYENNERVIVFDKGTADEYSVVISKLDEDELFYVQSGFEFRFRR